MQSKGETPSKAKSQKRFCWQYTCEQGNTEAKSYQLLMKGTGTLWQTQTSTQMSHAQLICSSSSRRFEVFAITPATSLEPKTIWGIICWRSLLLTCAYLCVFYDAVMHFIYGWKPNTVRPTTIMVNIMFHQSKLHHIILNNNIVSAHVITNFFQSIILPN